MRNQLFTCAPTTKRVTNSVKGVQAASGCISSPLPGHDIRHCWHCDNVRCHFDVAERHPGKGKLSVAKGCANGVVGNQCQKELLSVSINVLPILQAETNIIENRTTECDGG